MLSHHVISRGYRTLALSLFVAASPPTYSTEPAHPSIDSAVASQKAKRASQQRIDRLAEGDQSLLYEYRRISAHLTEVRAYNDQLERLTKTQQKEIESFARQSKEIRLTERKIVPLMLQMLQVLEQFILLDAPFLVEERRLRLGSLKQLMDNPNTSLHQKYRRLMEAYQIEEGYGRSLEAYPGTLQQDGRNRPVEFLRVGRLALVYASLDGLETGYWDRRERIWVPLPPRYNQLIESGLKTARKETPPGLIRVPVPLAQRENR